MKIAHISDVHIRNHRYHEEYKAVFEDLYEKLRELKPDIIVNTGDTAHTKLQLSPAYFDMTAKFFENLADIAPFHVILGNHDLNLRNPGKIDAITPIVEALDHKDIHFHKFSQEVDLGNGFTLNVLSIIDEDKWIDPTDDSKVNIALFHGSVAGVTTDTGWIMDHGDIDIKSFTPFDYVLLGDIHKTFQKLDDTGRVAYPGSLVQQNFGESEDKGFLLWDIEDKDNFTCEHFPLANPKPFVTIELTPKGKMPKKIEVPSGARLRLVSQNNLPLDVMRRALDIAKGRFKPESVTFLNRSSGERGSVQDITDGINVEDLRDPEVQEELIDEYLKDYEATPETLEAVFSLNRKYNTMAEEEEEISRNVNWSLKSFEWDNLFNYGEGNKVNFAKLNGIVGIFGKNYSGKSSIIDAFLYTLFNSTSKNERKNLNVINQNKDEGRGRLEITIGERDYLIERNSFKYLKKLKGNETMEAKTDINFSCYDNVMQEETELNGDSRNGTDKNIRKMFGTVEDFLLTSMASQVDSLSFINEGSTKRKEILGKFLDLEIFDKKFKKAKEDASDMKGALKLLEGKEYDTDIADTTSALEQNTSSKERQERKCRRYSDAITETENVINEIEQKISSIPAEIINIVEVKEEQISKQKETHILSAEITQLKEECKAKRADHERINEALKDFDVEALRAHQEEIDHKRVLLDNTNQTIEQQEYRLGQNKNKVKLLLEVPCGNEYSSCKFIKDAYNAQGNLVVIEKNLRELREETEGLFEDIENLDPKSIERKIEKYEEVLGMRDLIYNTINQNELIIDKNESNVSKLDLEIEKLQGKIEEYEDNREAIENLEHLIGQKVEQRNNLKAQQIILDECNEEKIVLIKERGSLEQKLENLISQKKEMETLRDSFSAYDLFMRCMHTNGISLDVIKKKLPVINDEISKVLANVVEFEVFFESEGNKLDIFIKHPKYEARPIEMGSGAEKTIAAMAIRLALLSVSSLPKGSIFILDEPATALDAENMEGFIGILDMVKSYYQTVLLISHVDHLKDVADMTIEIDKVDGFACVNQ
jgi:DNA repair exonuclease SbcCD nuclease subunit/ABC-type Na+ transport system ATPase subunit NatA